MSIVRCGYSDERLARAYRYHNYPDSVLMQPAGAAEFGLSEDGLHQLVLEVRRGAQLPDLPAEA